MSVSKPSSYELFVCLTPVCDNNWRSTAVAKKNVVVGMCWLRLTRLKGKHGQEGCSGVLYTHLQKRQDWVWLDRLGCTNAKITGYILFWSDSQHVWNRVKEPDIHFPGCGLSGRPAVSLSVPCLLQRYTVDALLPVLLFVADVFLVFLWDYYS